MPAMPYDVPTSAARRRPARAAGASRRAGRARAAPTPDDRFFRHIVSSMRNGVIAIHRDGTLALMNDEAYRIFALTRAARRRRPAVRRGLARRGRTSSACCRAPSS